MKIKFSDHKFTKQDLKIVTNVLKSGWLTHGKFTSKFEEEFKIFTNSKFSTTVSSCTAGLHLACLALNIKNGDEVIVPAMTHTATSHAVEYTGAKAVFADVDYPEGNINIEDIKKKITYKTKAIIVVHMAGYPCNMDQILKICKKNKIFIIEDCAHSLGSKYKNKHLGNFGVCGVFSFYPTKQITTGEGGMIISNNKKFYKKLKTLKAFGIDKDINDRKKQGDYDVKLLGLNYRMTDFQAALGYQQIKRYKKSLQRRKFNAKNYIKNLSNINGVEFTEFKAGNSYFVFQIFLEKKNRDKILKIFKNKNVGASVHYMRSLPEMTYYKKKYKIDKNKYRNSVNYGLKNISLPTHPNLKLKEIQRICKIIKNNI